MKIVDNACVYGFDQSVKASKYPMSTKLSDLTTTITDGVLKRAQAPQGSGHDQFLTGIIVQFDLTLTKQAWAEAERYHFLDFVSSQSTMHRLSRMDLSKQCCEYVDGRVLQILREKVAEYNAIPAENLTEKREAYLRMIYNAPAGLQLTARMTTNYRQLKTIYTQRKDHRLPEWQWFCKWIETLPHSEFITGHKEDEKNEQN